MPKTDQNSRNGAAVVAKRSSSKEIPENGRSNAKRRKRLGDSRFKQQKLSAYQPILTAGTVWPMFFVIGVIFIPMGVLFFVTSKNVQEYVFDYTDDACKAVNPELSNDNVCCKDVIKNETLWNKIGKGVCECKITVAIKEDVAKPVFIYYGLTNFYQNHRRYVKSRSDKQLLGEYQNTEDCYPFDMENHTVIYPCGAVANSLFNDTFFITRETSKGNEFVSILFNNIAWPSDRNKKFMNPSGTEQGNWNTVSSKVAPPPYWRKPIWEFDSENENENGVKNESFIVWMRTAALPTFRKLHSRIDHEQKNFDTGLPAGNYTILIGYNYPVDLFDGRKRFIISNTSWAGGKNPFLGVALMSTGTLCVVTGLVFIGINLKFGKTLPELADVN